MKEFNKQIQEQFSLMTKTNKLFKSSFTGKQVWNLYLESFEDDPKFRDPKSSQHNCNHCDNFIKRYGNIVAIDENLNLITLFDFEAKDEYIPVAKALSKEINKYVIKDVFFETYNELNSLPYESCNKTQSSFRLGIDKNIKRYTKAEAELYGVVKPNELRTFNHFHLNLPSKFVNKSGNSIESIIAKYKDKYSVFKRTMEEIPLDTLNLVNDLINQGSLLNGTAHLHFIDEIILYYSKIPKFDTTQKSSLVKTLDGSAFVKKTITSIESNWFWKITYNMSERTAKFKNTLIGTLCSELAEGMELNKACLNWNKRVDPANYHKATAPITQKQIAEAKLFVEDNNYTESFNRRFATIDDINISEILHSNVGNGEIKSVSIFDNVKSSGSGRHKRNEFENIEEVHIDKFMRDILPGCASIEVMLENRMDGNMCTLTTANIIDSKGIFKYSNNYSKTFNGNLAGKSQIKEAVKAKGGKIDGILRFSIMWAENDEDNSDLDAHCIEPDNNLISFSLKRSHRTKGQLDIDITNPKSQMPNGAVENIVHPNITNMIDGTYTYLVHQYSKRNSKGFKAEIEFNGEIYPYEYNQFVIGKIKVAEVTLKNGEFTIKHLLPETTSSKEIYGLETNNFHKVNLMCLSPNHWGTNRSGNKYYMFMLDKCKTSNSIRSFHNEDLIPELLKHRKVMEVLGASTMLEPVDIQLSGLGFNSTVRDELIVKVQGTHKRMLKIKF